MWLAIEFVYTTEVYDIGYEKTNMLKWKDDKRNNNENEWDLECLCNRAREAVVIQDTQYN